MELRKTLHEMWLIFVRVFTPKKVKNSETLVQRAEDASRTSDLLMFKR